MFGFGFAYTCGCCCIVTTTSTTDMKQKAETDYNVTTIRISKEVHKLILRCGKMGDTIDDVLRKVLLHYIEHELSKEK
jgi:hypothetical protein